MATKKTKKKSARKNSPGPKPKKRPEPVPTVAVFPTSECIKCGSIERSKYVNTRKVDVGYGTKIFRRCKCEKCGQWRDDVEFLEKRDSPGESK